MFGAFFVPFPAQASFLGGIGGMLGRDAYASAPVVAESNKNSQTMALLEVSGSNAISLPDKSKKKEDTAISDAVDVKIMSDNALVPAATQIASPYSDSVSSSDSPVNDISVYVVRKGDTIGQIADMFGVSSSTILWANNMKKGDKLTEGMILAILPVDGVEHTVTKGQTLQSIAKLYKADVQDIADINNLSVGDSLAVGDVLIVPDGVKAEESDKPIKNLNASIAKDKKYYESHPTQNLSGYYINPVPGARKSQGIHDRNAVDLAVGTGTPIMAAASGRVTLARTGYNGGFGNLVIISHPNGTETLYAHQSRIATSTGAQVSQGEVIGYVGSTGHSTGPHLHFEVHGARNPGADGSWKY